MSSKYNIVDAIHINGYELKITFGDGFAKTVNFHEYWTNSNDPYVADYKGDKFKQFTLENGNIMWGDHDIIFETAYLRDQIINFQK